MRQSNTRKSHKVNNFVPSSLSFRMALLMFYSKNFQVINIILISTKWHVPSTIYTLRHSQRKNDRENNFSQPHLG